MIEGSHEFVGGCPSPYSPGITKCDRLLLQSESGFKKSDKLHYKVYQAVESLTVIIK